MQRLYRQVVRVYCNINNYAYYHTLIEHSQILLNTFENKAFNKIVYNPNKQTILRIIMYYQTILDMTIAARDK